MAKEDLCYKTTAIEILGLTPKSFEKLNIKPVKEIPNPHYKNNSPSQLYNRKEIEKMVDDERVIELRPKPRKPVDYSAKFKKRYNNKNEGIPDACHYLFNLNRYCKHISCAAYHREEIYSLKRKFIKFLYEKGYAQEVYKHVNTKEEKECFKCDGSGIFYHFKQGPVECYTCDGTGVLPELNFYFIVFKFCVHDTIYTWHLPEEQVDFSYEITQSTDNLNDTTTKPIKINKKKLKEGKELIKWVME